VCAGRRIASKSGWEEERMAEESVFMIGLEVERTGEEIVVGNKVVGRRRKEEEKGQTKGKRTEETKPVPRSLTL